MKYMSIDGKIIITLEKGTCLNGFVPYIENGEKISKGFDNDHQCEEKLERDGLGELFTESFIKWGNTESHSHIGDYRRDKPFFENLKIYIDNFFGDTELVLPKSMMNNLALYLDEENQLKNKKINGKSLDCVSFANILNGISIYSETEENWYSQEIKFNNTSDIINELTPGNTIIIGEKNINNSISKKTHFGFKDGAFHYAIYLGEGYFISKIGSGPIAIQNLEQIKKIYNFETIYKISPKEGMKPILK